MQKKINATDGLTTVEIVVSITISAIVIIGLIPILASFFNSLQDLISRTKQANDIFSAVQSIQNDLLYSSALLRFSSLNDDESLTRRLRWGQHQDVWDFKGQGPEKRHLILQKALTVYAPGTHSAGIIRRGYKFSASCARNYASPVYYNVIYYLDGTTLYKRTLAPVWDDQISDIPGDTNDLFHTDMRASWCNFIKEASEKTTTRSGQNSTEKDIAVLKNVDLFSIEYFDTPHAQNPIDHYALPNNDGMDDSIQSKTRKLIYLPNNPKDIRITLRTKKPTNNKENILTISTRGAIAW